MHKHAPHEALEAAANHFDQSPQNTDAVVLSTYDDRGHMLFNYKDRHLLVPIARLLQQTTKEEPHEAMDAFQRLTNLLHANNQKEPKPIAITGLDLGIKRKIKKNRLYVFSTEGMSPVLRSELSIADTREDGQYFFFGSELRDALKRASEGAEALSVKSGGEVELTQRSFAEQLRSKWDGVLARIGNGRITILAQLRLRERISGLQQRIFRRADQPVSERSSRSSVDHRSMESPIKPSVVASVPKAIASKVTPKLDPQIQAISALTQFDYRDTTPAEIYAALRERATNKNGTFNPSDQDWKELRVHGARESERAYFSREIFSLLTDLHNFDVADMENPQTRPIILRTAAKFVAMRTLELMEVVSILSDSGLDRHAVPQPTEIFSHIFREVSAVPVFAGHLLAYQDISLRGKILSKPKKAAHYQRYYTPLKELVAAAAKDVRLSGSVNSFSQFMTDLRENSKVYFAHFSSANIAELPQDSLLGKLADSFHDLIQREIERELQAQ